MNTKHYFAIELIKKLEIDFPEKFFELMGMNLDLNGFNNYIRLNKITAETFDLKKYRFHLLLNSYSHIDDFKAYLNS